MAKTQLYAREGVAFDETVAVRDTNGDPVDLTGFALSLPMFLQAGSSAEFTLATGVSANAQGLHIVEGGLRIVIDKATLEGIDDDTGDFDLFGDLLGDPDGGTDYIFVTDVRLNCTAPGVDFKGATYQVTLNALAASVIAALDAQVDAKIEEVEGFAGDAAASALEAREVVDDVRGLYTTSEVLWTDEPTSKANNISLGQVVFDLPITDDGNLTAVHLFAGSAGTLTIKRFTKVGTDYVLVADSELDLTFPDTGAISFTPDDFGAYPVLAGERLGIAQSVAGIVTFTNATLATGVRYSYTANASATTIAEGASYMDPSIGFETPLIDITHESLKVAQDTSAANAATLVENSDRVVQVIGCAAAPATGLSAVPSNYIMAEPAHTDGVVKLISHWAMTAGTVIFGVATRSGATFTRTAKSTHSVSVGLNQIEVSLPILAGQFVTMATTATGVATSIAAVNGTPLVYNGAISGEVITDTDGELSSGNSVLQTQFAIEADVFAAAAENERHTITVRNSDRINIAGDSYSAGHYAQRGKQWVQKASMWTDFCFENFAVSGNTFPSMLAQIRAGASPFGTAPFQNTRATYVWIMLGKNDAAGGVATATEGARALIQTVRGLGAIPIISTEWLPVFGDYGQFLMKSIAEDEGAIFFDNLTYSKQMRQPPDYAGFFGGGHPGVRTNDLIAEPAIAFLNALPVKQSMKVFRKRDGVSVSDVGDLLFDDRFDRVRLFREIYTGQMAMEVDDEGWYDKLENPHPSTGNYGYFSRVASEYMALSNGEAVDFDDYGLIDVTLPALQKNVRALRLVLNDPDITVYYRDIIGTPNAGTGEPMGVWTEITGAEGVFALDSKSIERAIRADKISLLLYKSGGFSLVEPKLEWVGEAGKPNFPKVPKLPRSKGDALIANPDMGSLTGWTTVGTIASFVPDTGMLPLGSTGCVTVSSSDKIRRTLTYTSDAYRDRELEVRVVCRRFPDVFDPEDDYASAPITQDSFDYEHVYLDLIAPAHTDYLSNGLPILTYTMREHTGLWWKEVIFRTMLPLGTTTFDIQVSAGSEVQVARVHADLVE